MTTTRNRETNFFFFLLLDKKYLAFLHIYAKNTYTNLKAAAARQRRERGEKAKKYNVRLFYTPIASSVVM